MKDAITWTMIGLAFFASIFGAYQIFVDDTSALPVCPDIVKCEVLYEECNASASQYVCRCQGGPLLWYCYPGEPNGGN